MGEIDISHQQSYQPIRSSVHSFTHSFIHPPVQQLYVLTIKCVPDIVPGVWGSQNLTSSEGRRKVFNMARTATNSFKVTIIKHLLCAGQFSGL